MPGEISWGERILASDPGNVRIALATRAALSLAVALAGLLTRSGGRELA